MKKVTIYSTPSCHFCQMAKEYFKENNVEYTEKDVSEDAKAREEMIEKTEQMGVPVIEIGEELFVGFDKNIVAQKLGLK